MKLLVEYLEEDARVGVKNFILKELIYLAVKGGHLWNADHIMAVVRFARDAVNPNLQCNSLEVLASLAESSEAAFKLLNLSKRGKRFLILKLRFRSIDGGLINHLNMVG